MMPASFIANLKPANIFIMQRLRKTGSGATHDGFVKVGDFGLAKIIQPIKRNNF